MSTQPTQIHLSDPDNRDDVGGSYEFTGTAEQVIAYLDGPLRGDVMESGQPDLDTAIAALRAGHFEQAQHSAQAVGVWLTAAPPQTKPTRKEQY